MAFTHKSIEEIISRSRIRTAAEAVKSVVYDDAGIDSFIQSVCEMADDYEKKFCLPRSRGWSNQ